MITCTNYEGLNHVCKLFSLVLKIKKKLGGVCAESGNDSFQFRCGSAIRNPKSANAKSVRIG